MVSWLGTSACKNGEGCAPEPDIVKCELGKRGAKEYELSLILQLLAEDCAEVSSLQAQFTARGVP